MTSIFKKIGPWLAKLAFWRKHAETSAEAETEDASDQDARDAKTPVAPVRRDRRDEAVKVAPVEEPKPHVFTRIKQIFTRCRKPVEVASDEAARTQANDAAIATEQPAARQPGFVARFTQMLCFWRKPSAESDANEDDVTQIIEKPRARSTDKDSEDETEAVAPKPGFAARLKQMLRLRRKPIDAADTNENDATQVIDKPTGRSSDDASEGDAEAAPPSRLKRLFARLRNKWIWIPTVSLVVVGLLSWLVVMMLLATHKSEQLQAELKAAKKLLEQKKVTAEKPPTPVPPVAPEPAPAPEKPAPKIDPAFQIVGHIPAAQSEETAGMDASDCLVKDKESVAANLKNCITSFNEAVASMPPKAKSKTP